jgi:RNA polymerase sigma-70 factor (ECF subfamily)
MYPAGTEDRATQIDALIKGRAFDRAATAIIEAYAAELFGFLVNVLGNEGDAAEVFSQVGEDLWRGLAAFRGTCSARTWLYVLARNAVSRHRRAPFRRQAHLTGDALFDAAVHTARTPTPLWQRTGVKDKWRALRDALCDEDRTLLVLRVDRGFEWEDVARVTLGATQEEPLALRREAARLRKRFQLLKQELRDRAREAGLVDGDK